MKRIITLLIVILFSQSAIGQIAKKMNQESEATKEATFSKIHKKAIKEGTNRSATTNYNASALNRTTFSDNRTLDSLTTQEWDNNSNQWVPGIREQFTYDTDDRVNEAILSIWSSDTSSWELFEKDEFTYDTNGNLTLHLNYIQFPTNVWVFSKKSEFTYDGNNNLILENLFWFDWIYGVWMNTYKYELTYDMNQNLTLDIGYGWLGNQWTNFYMDEYIYTNSELSSEVNSLWNNGTNQWDYDKQWLYTFIAGELITELEQDWEDNIGWINLNKHDYTYNTNGSLDMYTLSIWDTNLTWIYKYKDDYQYDSSGNRTIGTYSEWFATGSGWTDYYKDEYVFDLNYNLVDIIIPFFYETTLDDEHAVANNMVIAYLGFEKDNLVWVDIDKMLFFYSNYNNPLDVDDYTLANALKVYPNPTRHILVIESEIPIDKVEIYSILGKKVMEVHTGFETIPFYDFADGVYIVKITSGSHSISKRIIKK